MLDRLPGDVRDQVEVLVQGQHCQPGEFSAGRDEKIRDGWAPMLATIGQQQLHLNCAVFGCGGEIFDRHQGKRW